jgi:hypothetical protein
MIQLLHGCIERIHVYVKDNPLHSFKLYLADAIALII